MFNAIELLEKIGQSSRLRHAATAQLRGELAISGIDVATQLSILSGDRAQLNACVGAQQELCCLIEIPDHEECDSRLPSRAAFADSTA